MYDEPAMRKVSASIWVPVHRHARTSSASLLAVVGLAELDGCRRCRGGDEGGNAGSADQEGAETHTHSSREGPSGPSH